ncbi:hypothetical protein ACLOJK_038794 [Asimina triloba]
MDEVRKELDEVKEAMRKLTADYQAKAELAESVKKAHNEQLIKVQEANQEIENQARELNAKRDELSLVRQLCEGLKADLHEKESAVRHLSSVNDQLRTNCDEKLQTIGMENRKLIFALDETNAKVEGQDQKICSYKEEIEGLKGLLSASQKKCIDAEEKAKASKELKQRDDLLLKLEQEIADVSDQLKWRNEQFKHLKEAHDKLHEQFQASKKDWEAERSSLLDKICKLQTNLESQTRVSQDLRSQLQMCNQALAQEESRRKLLEIQVSELEKCYQNVVTEFQGAQTLIETLTMGRDKEIAALRDSLALTETLLKEKEFMRAHLEQENQELLASVKELQEAQINHSAATSLSKTRQKLRALEQVHKDCSSVLKSKEAEWNSKIEKMETDLGECQFELFCKEKQVKELQTELDACHSSMMQLKTESEENSMRLMVMESQFSQSQMDLKNLEAEREWSGKRKDEQISALMEQLEKKNKALLDAQAEIGREREMKSLFVNRAESVCNEQHLFLMQKELERCKEMIQESCRHQERLKEQGLGNERALNEDLKKASDALDKANSALAEKGNKVSEITSQLERLKVVTEQIEASKLEAEIELKACCDENQKLEEKLEATLLAKMESEESFKQEKALLHQILEEKVKCLNDLQQRSDFLEQEYSRRESDAAVLAHEAEKTFMQEKERLLQMIEGKDKRNEDLQQQFLLLRQECERRKMEASVLLKEAEKGFMKEKERSLQIVEKKDILIENLQQKIVLLEQESLRRETEAATLAKMEADKTFNKEKDGFHRIITEKESRIEDLQQQILSLEQEMTKLVEAKNTEINTLYRVWEKIATDWLLSEIEVQQQNCLFAEQEEEIDGLRQKLKNENESLSGLKKLVEQIETDLVLKGLEMEREIDHQQEVLRGMESTVQVLESRVEELKAGTKELLEVNARLASEKDELLCQMMEFSDQIDCFLSIDAELMISLERIVQKGEKDDVSKQEENNIMHSKLKTEFLSDERLPFKVINS